MVVTVTAAVLFAFTIGSCQGIVLYEMCPTKVIPVTSGGVLTTPSFPSNYPIDVDCVATIKAPPGYKIWFHPLQDQFTFELEAKDEVQCKGCCDWMQVVDSQRQDQPLTQKLCGSQTTFDLKSLSNEVRVSFYSDNSLPKQGFSLPFEVVLEPLYTICQDSTTAALRGTIVSPEWPSSSYPTNKDCKISVTVPEGHNIQLTSQLLEMETDSDCSTTTCCSTDWLEFRDINRNVIVRKFCSGDPSAELLSNTAVIEFHSDGYNKGNFRGFQFVYEAVYVQTTTISKPTKNGTEVSPVPTGQPSVNFAAIIAAAIVGGAVLIVLLLIIVLVVRRKTGYCQTKILGNFLCCSVAPVLDSPRPPKDAVSWENVIRREDNRDDFEDRYLASSYRSRTPSPDAERGREELKESRRSNYYEDRYSASSYRSRTPSPDVEQGYELPGDRRPSHYYEEIGPKYNGLAAIPEVVVTPPEEFESTSGPIEPCTDKEESCDPQVVLSPPDQNSSDRAGSFDDETKEKELRVGHGKPREEEHIKNADMLNDDAALQGSDSLDDHTSQKSKQSKKYDKNKKTRSPKPKRKENQSPLSVKGISGTEEPATGDEERSNSPEPQRLENDNDSEKNVNVVGNLNHHEEEINLSSGNGVSVGETYGDGIDAANIESSTC